MGSLVLSLDSVRATDVARVGGKGASLGTLLGAGFPVPPGLCITTHAFSLALVPFRAGIEAALRDRDCTDPLQAAEAARAIREQLATLRMPEGVADAVRAALPELAKDGEPVAVRSSATDEDGAQISFAGQYETALGLRGEEPIVGAVVDCWRSFYSANALVARAAVGRRDGAMAVLVQRMVDAECAGVCFTRDPVHPERGLLVIDAAWGLGAGTVDGSVATDTAWLLRDEPQRIDDRRVVEKVERVALDAQGGVRRETVAGDRRRAACLPEPWLHRVAELAIASEVLFGRPQDVEWAIADEQLWVLQSRPITTLAPEHARSWDVPRAWDRDADRATIWRLDGADRQELPTSLEADVSDLFCKAMADAHPINAWGGYPRQRVIDGRRYISQVPGDMTPGDRRIRRKALSDLALRMRAEGKTMWDHWAPEIEAAIARLRAFDHDTADDAKVAEHLEDALGTFRRHWMVHWCPWTDDQETQPWRKAFSAVSGLEGRDAEQGLAALVDGEETILTRLIDELHAMARAAAAVPAVAALVRGHPAGAWPRIEQMPDATFLREKLAAFLGKYGDHMGMGYGSASSLRRPTWRQDPSQVLAMMRPYLEPGLEAPSVARARARLECDARVEQLCAACTDAEKVAEFRRWLPVARREATLLEEHNYVIDQVAYGQVRTAVGTAARRLRARGILVDEDDIFWLHVDEILAALRSTQPESKSALVAQRKAEAQARRSQKPPPLLGVPQAQLDPRPPLKDDVTAGAPEGATRLTGIGASAGRRRGRARIVPVTAVVPTVASGEVLVAVNAGPAWTPIFPVLGALVLDEGAFGQHATTTAREYGVPAVVRTHNATRRVPDGAWVLVDGEAGTVEIEQGDTDRAADPADATPGA